jgi:hypothetical protein
VPATFQEWITAATDEEQKYATLVSYTSPIPWTRWTPSNKNTRPISSSNHQAIPMDVDIICKAAEETEEDEEERICRATTPEEKAEHHKTWKCYECSKIGHMAKNCPLKKKFKKVSPPKDDPLNEYLRIIHPLAEEDKEEEEEEMPPLEGDSTSYEPDDIETIAARTAAFSPAEREAWVQAMQDLGMDFQQA